MMARQYLVPQVQRQRDAAMGAVPDMTAEIALQEIGEASTIEKY